MMIQIDPLGRLGRQKFKISIIQDGGDRHLEKSKMKPYLGRGLTDFDDIWHDDAL